MILEKYKWKSRILLVSTPSYKDRIYLEAKKIYQAKIKDFHKRYVKLICKINIKEKSSISLIGFDGKSKKKMNNLNHKTIFTSSSDMRKTSSASSAACVIFVEAVSIFW